MSFGFSPSDIVVAYELAQKIYHYCFTKAQCADVRYFQFGRDINSLAESLKRLDAICTNANDQLTKNSWHDRDTERVTAGVLSTLPVLTGDFRQTLRDCEKLLSDKSKFARSASGFIDNVVWHSSTERDVNRLRERVHFHMIKVDFIAKPFEIQLLLGIRRQLQLLTRQVANLRAVLDWDPARQRHAITSNAHEACFSVPEDLSDRFDKARASKDLDSSQARDDLPLKEGFDALVYHFAKSTVNFESSPGLGQDVPVEQYLNLVKSRWILDRLKESAYFVTLDPDSLWTECVRELEDKVRDQLVRFQHSDLRPPPLDILSRLPDDCFSIWVDEDPRPGPTAQTEHRAFEEKILELALQSGYSNHSSTLTIFRRSDTALRLVSATKDDKNQGVHHEESTNVDMVQTELVPIFAASQDNLTDNNNLLLCNRGQDTESYSLRNLEDVAQFQRALTGFRVSHDMSNIALLVELSGFNKPSIYGQVRLQFWHLKPLPKIQQRQDIESSEGSSSSSNSPAGSSELRRFWTSGTTQLPGNSVVFPVNGSRGNGIALTHPVLPVLIIFTKCERKYAFLHIQLEKSIFWKQQPCPSCRNQNKPCSRILIQSNSKTFLVRKLIAQQEGDQGLRAWNLGCFRHPEHPGFKKLEVLKVKYLSLHFETPERKDEFCREFESLKKLRDIDINEYERTLQETKYISNNPRSHEPFRWRSSERCSSH